MAEPHARAGPFEVGLKSGWTRVGLGFEIEKIRPLSWGQGWLRPQRSFTGSGEGMIMQSLKRSLRFRWLSSQMEANLEASDLTATELPPTNLKAFHSLTALDSSSTFPIREACGHFRRPRKKKL